MSAQPVLSPTTPGRPAVPGTSPHPIVELNHVSKSFAAGGGSPVTILDDINFQVEEGEMLALLGQSGSGKSTILRLMAGLAQPSEGVVLRHGERLVDVNRSLSIVFQSFALYPWLTVSENVQVGLINRRLPAKEEEAEIEHALELIGLSGYENAYPKELSGGMRQRVGFARAIVARPEILCMDEAFSALDVLTAENLRTEVVNLWQDRREEQRHLKSIFFVTHNIAEAVFMATRIVIISSHPGRIKHVIHNPLPYPRDVNSKEFQALVSQIHESDCQPGTAGRARCAGKCGRAGHFAGGRAGVGRKPCPSPRQPPAGGRRGSSPCPTCRWAGSSACSKSSKTARKPSIFSS